MAPGEHVTIRRMALEPSRIGDYRIGGPIGSGATAQVFEAIHVPTGRQVALKQLDGRTDAELSERVAREAILLGGVNSAHVSSLIGFGFDKGSAFLVLERLIGETLDARIKRDGPVPLVLCAAWVEQLLIGLKDVHAAGIIHRDIKPSNIFLQQDPEQTTRKSIVKLIDFGVARLEEMVGHGSSLTAPKHMLGSMGYMAPEQCRQAKGVSFTADIYSVGVVIFRMVSGRLPLTGASMEEMVRVKLNDEPPLLSHTSGHAHHVQLDWFVDNALSRDPAKRFQTAKEMLHEWKLLVRGLDDENTVRVSRLDRADLGIPDSLVPAASPTATSAASATMPRAEAETSFMESTSRSIPAPADVSGGDEHPPLELSVDDATTQLENLQKTDPPDPYADEFEVPTKNDPELGQRVLEVMKRKRDAEK